MQSGRNAAEAVKESAANVGASAKAGMEKTKATAQEKVIFQKRKKIYFSLYLLNCKFNYKFYIYMINYFK